MCFNYNSLPSFEGALKKYQEIEKNPGKLFDKISTVFHKHEVENKFTLCLLHRHYDVFEDEIIVTKEEDNFSLSAPESKNGMNFLPVEQSWVLMKVMGSNDILCYPFEYGTTQKERPGKQFIIELFQVLHEFGVEDVFGVAADVNKECHTEITKSGSRASITYKQYVCLGNDEKETPTVWNFSNPNYPFRQLMCRYIMGQDHVHDV